jgi:antitoxin (DNA-binding transcriptional repressor) of toxin-antitoxin stability system
LPELIDRVLDGEEVTLTRHGHDVAVIVRPDALRVRRSAEVLAEADRLRERLDVARSAKVPRRGLSRQRADERVRDLRADRGRR